MKLDLLSLLNDITVIIRDFCSKVSEETLHYTDVNTNLSFSCTKVVVGQGFLVNYVISTEVQREVKNVLGGELECYEKICKKYKSWCCIDADVYVSVFYNNAEGLNFTSIEITANGVDISQNITEEQFFQLDLIHDYGIGYDSLRTMIDLSSDESLRVTPMPFGIDVELGNHEVNERDVLSLISTVKTILSEK